VRNCATSSRIRCARLDFDCAGKAVSCVAVMKVAALLLLSKPRAGWETSLATMASAPLRFTSPERANEVLRVDGSLGGEGDEQCAGVAVGRDALRDVFCRLKQEPERPVRLSFCGRRRRDGSRRPQRP